MATCAVAAPGLARTVRADELPSPIDSVTAERIPEYQRTPPTWAFSLNGTPDAFGQTALTSDFNGTRCAGVSIQFEYLFPGLQNYGILAIGPELAYYRPTGGTDMLAYPNGSLVSAGGQIHYEARFFREQVIVPTLGYHFQVLRYALAAGPVGLVSAQGPSAGLMFLLNVLEPTSAGTLFSTYGISRSYLTFEAQSLTAENADLSFSGLSLFFGLRFEF